jgi:hypothetical protein
VEGGAGSIGQRRFRFGPGTGGDDVDRAEYEEQRDFLESVMRMGPVTNG